MAKLPYMQFYPSDWIQDTQTLTSSAKGAWIDILCQLWVSDTPGVRTWNRKEFTTLLRLTYDEEIEEMVADLSRVGDVVLTDSNGNEVELFKDCTWITVSSRRMVRDREALNARKDSHKRYNDKRARGKRQDNDIKTTCRSQKSEVRSQKSEVRNQKSERREEKKEEKKEIQILSASSSTRGVAKSSRVWDAYDEAYRHRYGVHPVRDQQTNSLLCRLVDKLGEVEAPQVAAFYLSHNHPFYVSKRHPPNLLVQDATGLRTQWATGVKATTGEARSLENRDNLASQYQRVLAKLEGA